MTEEIKLLAITAASIGFLHTLFGPDHYLPFIVMSKARKWSIVKTMWLTLVCGIGHVGSSVVLGAIGIAMGIGVRRLEYFESFRGNIAAWALMLFGFIYMCWGIYKAIKNKPHKHIHYHENGTVHQHKHVHATEMKNENNHIHKNNHEQFHEKEKPVNLTPWILIVVFVLGPCEPLIPILMYPAAEHNIHGLVLVSVIFSAVTIFTMLVMVVSLTYGLKIVKLGKLDRYTHAIAGAAVFLSGVAIVFLGL